MTDLDRDGYTVLPGAVPPEAVHAALRAIGLGIRRHGLPGGAEHAACQHGTFLPELRDDPAIWALIDAAEIAGPTIPLLGRDGDSWAEPQILLRFPDEAPWCDSPCPHADCDDAVRPALVPHVDEEPPWAGHKYVSAWHSNRCAPPCLKPASDPIHVRRRYRAIVGVALTDHGPDDGALHVWPGTHLLNLGRQRRLPDPVPVPLKAGDAIVMHPRLAHAGSLNLGHTWQVRCYFRLLGAAEGAS